MSGAGSKKQEVKPFYKHARFYSINKISEMMGKAGLSVEAYSSTLLQLPSEKPVKEAAHKGLAEDAGFVCILAGKH